MSLSQLPSFYQRGNVDLRGPPGPPGNDGAQGIPGPQGEPGRDGKDGTADPAMDARVRAVEEDLGGFKASVGDTFTAITTETEAFAQRIQTVEAEYVSEDDVDLKVSAAIRDEQVARSTAVAAVASRIETIEADYTKAGDVDTRVNAKVSEEAKARADAVSAVASRVTALEASTGGGEGADPVARAAIEEEKRVRADAISAEAQARESLATTLRGETSAAVSSEAKARSDAVSAEASARESLAATLRGETDQKVSAAVTTEQKARADAVSAEASSRATLAADLRRQLGAASPALPNDFRLKDIFWRRDFNGADDRPIDFDPAVWGFDGSTVSVRNVTSTTGLFDTSTLGSVRLVAGRRHRLTVTWRIVYAGGLPDATADLFLIGLNAARSAIYNPAQNLVIGAGAPGWGTDTGWQRRSIEFADDDMIAQGCVYLRGLLRLIGRGTDEHWEIQTLTLEDVTGEAAVAARVSAEEQARADADGALASRLSTVEARFVGGGDVDQRVAAKVSEEAQARADAVSAVANRAEEIAAEVYTGPNRNTLIAARVADEAAARSNGDEALGSRITTVESTANGAKSSVETFQQALSTLDGRQEVYWGVTGTLPDGKVAISLRKKDGSPGEFLVDTNMRVTGNLLVDGTVNWKQIAVQDLGRFGSASWSGSFSPARGTSGTIPFGLALGNVKPSGYFTAVATIGVSTNAGQRTTTSMNGKPFYTNFIGDGGLRLGFSDAEGRFYPIVNGTTTFPNAAGSDFSPSVSAIVTNNSADTGIVDQGDYYERNLSATYTVTLINLQLRWSAI